MMKEYNEQQHPKKGIGRRMKHIIAAPYRNSDKIILRDYLAMQRTTLANERTLFSYIRTSLYLLLGGIGLTEVEVFSNLIWAGYAALVLSVIIFIYGMVRYFILRARLSNFYKTIDLSPEDLERIKNRDKETRDQPEEQVQR